MLANKAILTYENRSYLNQKLFEISIKSRFLLSCRRSGVFILLDIDNIYAIFVA